MVNLPSKTVSGGLRMLRAYQPGERIAKVSAGSARRMLFVIIGLFPTIFAIVYYGLIASDRFVSEARFVVRTSSKPAISGGLSSLLQMTGISRAQDDTFSVQEFIQSRSLIAKIPPGIDLKAIYGNKSADYLAQYPNIFFEDTVEGLYRYLRWMITLRYNPNTSITRLKVQAFRRDDAQRLAQVLLDLSEKVINEINTRIREDSMKLAEASVKTAQERVVKAQLAITDFRNRELMISPKASAVLMMELIGKLSGELARTQAQLAETRAGLPQGPQIQPLVRRARALEAQIEQEKARLGAGGEGLAGKISTFERLSLELKFSAQQLAAAMSSLVSARADAMRQQLYLVRIVEPNLPDKAIEPERLYNVLTTFAGNLIVLLILWLLQIGITSHGFAGVNRGAAES